MAASSHTANKRVSAFPTGMSFRVLTMRSEYTTVTDMEIQHLVERAGGVSKLAKSLGVSHSTVCGWLRLRRLPGSRVAQISALLDVPTVDVLALVAPASRRGV